MAGNAHADEEIRLLQKSLPFVITKGVANSTFSKYNGAWDRWLQWAATKNLVGRPADPYDVAIYLNYLLFVNKTKGAITSAVYAIRWGHHIVGMTSPTENPLVKLAHEGAIRLCQGEKTKKDPMPVEVLKEVVRKYGRNTSSLLDVRFTIVCLIGFAGFLRIDELLNVKLKHLSLFHDRMEIFLPSSKTDQHRTGKKVIIAKTSTEFCPVENVTNFLRLAKLDIVQDPEAYLVPRLHRTKKGHNASKTRGLSYTRIRETFMEKLDTIRESHEDFGLHSLRSGGASSAAQNGVTDRLISKQGRWVSENARNGYIKDDIRTRMSVTLSLGL